MLSTVGDRGVGRVPDEPRRIAVGERELVVRARRGAAVVGVEVDRRPVADAGDQVVVTVAEDGTADPSCMM